jgi:mRNA interferase MazF
VVEVYQGEVWWAELPEPVGSAPGFRRPVVVIQGDPLNRSRIGTVVCIPLTSNQEWKEAPGATALTRRATGLAKESVANATQVITLDRRTLTRRVGRLAPRRVAEILAGLDVVLGR